MEHGKSEATIPRVRAKCLFSAVLRPLRGRGWQEVAMCTVSQAYPFTSTVNCVPFGRKRVISVFVQDQQQVQYPCWSMAHNL